MPLVAEYIWIDGSEPTHKLRSKTRVIPDPEELSLETFPLWNFDGSSTNQADGANSDCILRPVAFVDDPVRGEGCFLVMAEVFNVDGSPHRTNARAVLREVLAQGADKTDAWFGFEQEYTLFKGSTPLGFPSERRFPAAQGPYYCGVGDDEVHGRELVESHLFACLEAGLLITGVNAEVMPGQWEFQCGGPDGDALTASDHLWLARWILYRIGEDMGISATLDPKPIPGDWNGAGMHTNFSTADMRVPPTADNDSLGVNAINDAVEKISKKVKEHLAVYGHGYEMRLTGAHETCRYDEFRAGISDRTASIRIPTNVATDNCGYLEDRRPNGNADPYAVAARMLATVCDIPL
ncbi:MAG: glutamine synthetase [Myxococcota bacterium]|jgi:glutamine synthetase